jgi:hypothetical protein
VLAVVPAGDEGPDLDHEIADEAEGAAADGLAFDDAESDLDQAASSTDTRARLATRRPGGCDPAADRDRRRVVEPPPDQTSGVLRHCPGPMHWSASQLGSHRSRDLRITSAN